MTPHHKRLIRKYLPPHPTARIMGQHFIRLGLPRWGFDYRRLLYKTDDNQMRLQAMMNDAFSYMPSPEEAQVGSYMRNRFSSYFS